MRLKESGCCALWLEVCCTVQRSEDVALGRLPQDLKVIPLFFTCMLIARRPIPLRVTEGKQKIRINDLAHTHT